MSELDVFAAGAVTPEGKAWRAHALEFARALEASERENKRLREALRPAMPNASTPDEVRAALAEAGPSPWLVDPDGWDTEEGAQFLSIFGGGVHGSAPEYCVANVSNYGQGIKSCEADAHLIANAPTWLAQLLAALEAKDGEVARLRGALAACYWAETTMDVDRIAAAALAPSTPPDLREDAP